MAEVSGRTENCGSLSERLSVAWTRVAIFIKVNFLPLQYLRYTSIDFIYACLCTTRSCDAGVNNGGEKMKNKLLSVELSRSGGYFRSEDVLFEEALLDELF